MIANGYNNLQCVWGPEQALALKADWRASGTTNNFALWAAERMKQALASVAATWSAQRVAAEVAAKAEWLQRWAACEPTATEWTTFTNMVRTAEARQAQ